MSIEKVKAFFRSQGMENRILEFAESSATVELAAHAVGCEPARIAKTLSFDLAGEPILVVTAGDMKVAGGKFKAAFHGKPKMLAADMVEGCIGHAVGGVCPFAVNAGVKVYLDISLKRFATVFPACGSSNSAIELTPEELEKCSGAAGWVDVCK
ncbi:MAG: YbaK/EbsC family protein [Selenomonadaceae bacterium]|nr:YbaK/EbsC family protein [Selenomonadaceae bacterium]MBR4491353.1 YbaK/EbsC family protein [Bacteroidales bacterium]